MIPKRYPGIFLVHSLMGFGGGLLSVEIRSAQSSFTTQIEAAGPGFIGYCELGAGPKEWSPHGLVPKDWKLLFRLDGLWVDVQMTYINIEGHRAMGAMNLGGKKNTCLYFVPM